jgi:hypothetical protein
MGHHGATLDEPLGIRTILQRICREGGPIQLRHGERLALGTLGEEREDRLRGDFPGRDLEALEAQVGDTVMLAFQDRGRQYQGMTELLQLDLGDRPLCALAPFRTLTCLNPEAFLDLAPDRPLRGTYVSVSQDLLDGRVVGCSEGGLELAWVLGRREDFRLGRPFAASLDLGPGCQPVLQVMPTYFTEGTVGLQVVGGQDVRHLERYLSWVREHLHANHERERLAFRREGLAPGREAPAARLSAERGLLVLADRAPLVLLVAEDEGLAHHLARALGRKFGIAYLDYVTGPLRHQLVRSGGTEAWAGIRLLLVHQRLRLTSGYDLIRQVVQKEACPLPVLLVGREEDLDLKRNHAVAAGAVDFMAVEPFHVLTVMRTLETTLQMFG